MRKFFLNNKKGQKGFTLIELMVAISIVALLATVVVTTLSLAKQQAQDAKVKATRQQVQLALDVYYQEHGGYPNPNPAHAELYCVGGTDCLLSGSPVITLLASVSTPKNKTANQLASPAFAFPALTGSMPTIIDNRGIIYASCGENLPVCPSGEAQLLSTTYQDGLISQTAGNWSETTGYAGTNILGCTDPNAYNYNSDANINDNSCYYHPGCTDPSASNYDSGADHDDGSCHYVAYYDQTSYPYAFQSDTGEGCNYANETDANGWVGSGYYYCANTSYQYYTTGIGSSVNGYGPQGQGTYFNGAVTYYDQNNYPYAFQGDTMEGCNYTDGVSTNGWNGSGYYYCQNTSYTYFNSNYGNYMYGNGPSGSGNYYNNFYTYSCQGSTSFYCPNYNNDKGSCESTYGFCSYTDGQNYSCTPNGNTSNCSDFNGNQDSCLQNTSCSWNWDDQYTCSGTYNPVDCVSLDPSSCSMNTYWCNYTPYSSGSCNSTPKSCTEIQDQTQCGYAGCSWQ